MTLRLPPRALALIQALAIGAGAARLEAAVFHLDEGTDRFRPGKSVRYIEDPTGQMNFDEIRHLPAGSPRWQTSDVEVPGFGYTASVYWIRLALNNRSSPETDWLLHFSYNQIDAVDFYGPAEDGRYTLARAGDNRRFSERPVPYRQALFPFHLSRTGGEKTFYLRVQSQGSVQIPLTIWTKDAFHHEVRFTNPAIALYYGVLISMIIYNLFLFLSFRDRSYFYYVMFILTTGIAQITAKQIGHQFLWPDSPWWNNVAMALFVGQSLFWYNTFIRGFLRTAEFYPRMNKVITVFQVWGLLVTVLPFFATYRASILTGVALAAVSIPATYVTGIISLLRGYRPARFFLLAFSAFMALSVLYIWRHLGGPDAGVLVTFGIEIGLSICMICLSLALGDKIRLEQLEARNKLKEQERVRTQFFHNTSHELRTPLNGILGFVELLMKDHYGKLPEKAFIQVAKIQHLATGLKNQVNTILDLARSRRGELTLLNTKIALNEVLEETRILCEGLMLKHPLGEAEVTAGWPEDSSPVVINDHDKITTIIRNLVGNAFKFGKPGKPNKIRITLDLDDHFALTIRIADEGIGIPEDQRERIFEEFTQVSGESRRAFEGTGLGLTMVRNLTGLLSGKIGLESSPEKGSTFVITLPAQKLIDSVKVPVNTATEVSMETPALTRVVENRLLDRMAPDEPALRTDGSYKLLVIDDNEVNCEVISDILGTSGFTVIAAAGGREGLEKARQEKPDLILLDLMMPGFSGEDVMKALKAEEDLTHIPVLLLTARASQEDKIFGLKLGADDYLSKPIISDEVVLRVTNTLARLDLARAKSEREILEKALADAQEVHGSMVKRSGGIPGIEVSHHYQPAELTGGDWIGFQHHKGSNRLFVLLGDVSGHGMKSALVTVANAGAVQGVLKVIEEKGEQLSMQDSLNLLVSGTNSAVYHSGHGLNLQMTMVFLAIDLRTGRAFYQNAGHNQIYRVGKEGTGPVLAPGNPLGLDVEPRTGGKELGLDSGDMLFLFTDGLIENAGPDGKVLTGRRLKKLLHGDNPDRLRKKVLDSAALIWQDHPAEDDCSFLVIRWQKPGAGQEAA